MVKDDRCSRESGSVPSAELKSPDYRFHPQKGGRYFVGIAIVTDVHKEISAARENQKARKGLFDFMHKKPPFCAGVRVVALAPASACCL